MANNYRVVLTPRAESMLRAIADRRVQQALVKRMRQLAQDPERQGKPLVGELAGLRSIRAVGQRYRILYRVQRAEVQVIVVAAGMRKEKSRADVYALAQKLVREGILGKHE